MSTNNQAHTDARITFKMLFALSSTNHGEQNTSSPCNPLFNKLSQLNSSQASSSELNNTINNTNNNGAKLEILYFLLKSCVVHSMNSEFGIAFKSWSNREKILDLSPKEFESVGKEVANWDCLEGETWEKFVNLMKLNKGNDDKPFNDEYAEEVRSLEMRSLVNSYMTLHNSKCVSQLFNNAKKIYLSPPKIAFKYFYDSSQLALNGKQDYGTELIKQVERDCLPELDREVWLESDRIVNRKMCEACIGSLMCAKQIQTCFEKNLNSEFDKCLLDNDAYSRCIENSYERIDDYFNQLDK
ncbi:predicted protein [Naegleria gruberi]|uniref:Predicted protein n=1 Tax=Naegleria gruberi TaxID=5762 RepID=D2VU73_NAEGR|nr:uncharacterized protein NAEGRDRAFT_52280 [Naegleria gruberi]EFC39637.1 predicted protein [Naegleria gruberi]|eukprot:XP_002672381.1 predicted protein [Naegleria gruberi strain NEG-M]